MIGAVIITHGAIADAIVEAAGAITGRALAIKTVSVKSGDGADDIKARLDAAVKEARAGAGGVLIFTDMFGGTPTNISITLIKEGEVEVVTGVNLPMIIKFINHMENKTLKEAVALLAEYGQKSVAIPSEMLKGK